MEFEHIFGFNLGFHTIYEEFFETYLTSEKYCQGTTHRSGSTFRSLRYLAPIHTKLGT